jgi:large subunit ribosomal protein L9
MKVILIGDVPGAGRRGDIIEVSPGHARNFLIPRKLALEANDANMKVYEREKAKIMKQREEEAGQARSLAGNMEKHSFTITVKTGENGKLFGSVTNADIAKVMTDNGYETDKHDVQLDEPIKEVGVYTVNVKLTHDVVAKVKVWIVEEKNG